MRPLRAILRHGTYALYSAVAGTALLWAILELDPGLLDRLRGLRQIEYYALKAEDSPDPDLLLVPRNPERHLKTQLVGDLFSPAYGVEEPGRPYEASYDLNGFRSNSSRPPYDIALIGDSFIEIGESDRSTLSERLHALTGRTTANLGRAWYGPYQYLTVLERYGVSLRPRYALFCFFAGNDIEDMRQYDRWREGGSYYSSYDVWNRSALARYAAAMGDTTFFLGHRAMGLRDAAEGWFRRHRPSQEPVHPDLGLVRVGTRTVPMAFAYWGERRSAGELLASRRGRALTSILERFRATCIGEGIRPVIVYIPMKVEVYDDFCTPESGKSFLERLAASASGRRSIEAEVRRLSDDLRLPLIDLVPAFKRATAEGRLLYYPFDSHWSPEGIEEAAHVLAVSPALAGAD